MTSASMVAILNFTFLVALSLALLEIIFLSAGAVYAATDSFGIQNESYMS